MATSNQQTKCVLLASAAEGAGVRGQLDARGWTALVSNDPLPALAELCLLERLDATRRAWGREGNGLALVVVDPARWAQLPAMISAARRYVPTARLWAFTAGALTPLASGDSDNGAGPSDRPSESNATPPASYQMRSEPEAATGTEGGNGGSPPDVTGDEISMLLDGNFRDEQIQEPPPPPPEDPAEHRETRDRPATDPEA